MDGSEIIKCAKSGRGWLYTLRYPDGTTQEKAASSLPSGRLAERVAFHRRNRDMPVPRDLAELLEVPERRVVDPQVLEIEDDVENDAKQSDRNSVCGGNGCGTNCHYGADPDSYYSEDFLSSSPPEALDVAHDVASSPSLTDPDRFSVPAQWPTSPSPSLEAPGTVVYARALQALPPRRLAGLSIEERLARFSIRPHAPTQPPLSGAEPSFSSPDDAVAPAAEARASAVTVASSDLLDGWDVDANSGPCTIPPPPPAVSNHGTNRARDEASGGQPADGVAAGLLLCDPVPTVAPTPADQMHHGPVAVAAAKPSSGHDMGTDFSEPDALCQHRSCRQENAGITSSSAPEPFPRVADCDPLPVEGLAALAGDYHIPWNGKGTQSETEGAEDEQGYWRLWN